MLTKPRVHMQGRRRLLAMQTCNGGFHYLQGRGQRALLVAAAAQAADSGSGGNLPHERRRVVVTGMGVTSSLGHEVGTFYDNLLAGKSGVSRIERFPIDAFSTQVGLETVHAGMRSRNRLMYRAMSVRVSHAPWETGSATLSAIRCPTNRLLARSKILSRAT